MSEVNKPNEHHIYLHVLCLCYLLIEMMDDLKGSKHYKFTLKHRAECFVKELQRIVNEDVALLNGKIDGKSLTGLFKNHEEFIKELGMIYTCDFPILAGILKMYREQPEDVLNKLDIIINTEVAQ